MSPGDPAMSVCGFAHLDRFGQRLRGDEVALTVAFEHDRRHLPVVTLRRAA